MVLSFGGYFSSLGNSSGALPPTSWVNNDLVVTHEVELKLGTYYLHGDIDAGFSWVASVGRATFTKLGFPFQNVGSNPSSQNYQAWGYYDISQVLPSLPETAFVDFSFKIFQPYSNLAPYDVSNTDWTFAAQEIKTTCWELIYLPLEAAPTEELILYSTISEDEKVEEINVSHGDGTNSATLNSYRLANGLITDVWNRRGVTDSSGILSLLLIQLRDLKGGFVKELNASLIGEIEVFNTIEHTTDEVSDYYIKTYDWAIETSEYSLTLSELATSVIPTVIVKSPTSSKVNPTPTDTTNLPLTSSSSTIGTGTIASPESSLSVDQSDLNNFI